MIITLKGANFASSNIGTLDSWLISKSLTGVTIDNTATSVKKGEAYKAVITLKENYTFPDTITVTMGDTDITSTYVTKTATTITINIPSVTGHIVIKVNATSNVVGVTYSITRNLTALTSDSSVNTITSGDTYEETFSIPKDMYDGYAGESGVEVDLTVKMGGSTLAPNTGAFTAELVYQQVSGVERATGFKVTVPNVSGNIAITATSYVPFNESIADTKVHHYTVKDKSIDIDGVSIGDVLIYANVSGAKVHGWTIPAGAKLTVTYKNTKAILSSETMVLLHKTSNNVLDYKSTYIAAAGIGSTSTFTFTNVYNDEVLLEANEGVIVSGRYTVVGGGITPGEPDTPSYFDITTQGTEKGSIKNSVINIPDSASLYLITKVALPSNAVSVEYQAFKTGGSYGSAFVDDSGTVVKFLPKTDVTTGDRVTEAVPSRATWFYHMWDDPAESDNQTAPAFTYIRVYTEGEIETPEGLPVRITEQTQDNHGLLDASTGVWDPQTYPAEQGGQTVTVCSIPAGATTVNYQMFKTGKTYGSGFFNGSTFISGYANNTDANGTRKTLSIPAGATEFWHMYPNRTYANGDGNCPEFDYIEFA